jgi:hypothetical protein
VLDTRPIDHDGARLQIDITKAAPRRGGHHVKTTTLSSPMVVHRVRLGNCMVTDAKTNSSAPVATTMFGPEPRPCRIPTIWTPGMELR